LKNESATERVIGGTVANPEQMKMLRQIQKMQQDMQAAQDALADETVEGSAGGGVVKATVNGYGDLQRVAIDPGVVDPDDVETLEDLVVAAVSEGVRKARELQAQKLGAATGGLGGLGGGVDDLLGGLLG
jgi:DNA-binding YbaB/EbfC family protein